MEEIRKAVLIVLVLCLLAGVTACPGKGKTAG
jgi:hypothetical protein